MSLSKRLGIDDSSGFEFAKEMLAGDVTAAINFDRIQQAPNGKYIIFEYLLCDEKQSVNPHTSHPKRYWDKNSRKFISLCQVASDLEAVLYLVNYAKKGTRHEDKILLMEVKEWNNRGVTTQDYKMTRSDFSNWFREQNEACL